PPPRRERRHLRRRGDPTPRHFTRQECDLPGGRFPLGCWLVWSGSRPPEPGADLVRSLHPAAVGLPSAPAVDATPHDCLACRAHRPLVSISHPTVVAAPRRSAPGVFVSSPSVLARV